MPFITEKSFSDCQYLNVCMYLDNQQQSSRNEEKYILQDWILSDGFHQTNRLIPGIGYQKLHCLTRWKTLNNMNLRFISWCFTVDIFPAIPDITGQCATYLVTDKYRITTALNNFMRLNYRKASFSLRKDSSHWIFAFFGYHVIVIIAIESTKTTSMEDVSTGVLEKKNI